MSDFKSNRPVTIFAGHAKEIVDYFAAVKKGETPKIPTGALQVLAFTVKVSQEDESFTTSTQVNEAIESLSQGLERIKFDTLGMIGFEKRTAFVGQGSWSGSHKVTFGELDTILKYLTSKGPVQSLPGEEPDAQDH